MIVRPGKKFGFQFRFYVALFQSELIVDVPRQRKVTSRYGKHDHMLHMSDLDSSNSDDDDLHGRVKKAKRKKCQAGREPDGSVIYTRAECFKVEKNLLVFGSVENVVQLLII